MRELGTSPKLMDERMGHEDGSVQARYDHVTKEMWEKLMVASRPSGRPHWTHVARCTHVHRSPRWSNFWRHGPKDGEKLQDLPPSFSQNGEKPFPPTGGKGF